MQWLLIFQRYKILTRIINIITITAVDVETLIRRVDPLSITKEMSEVVVRPKMDEILQLINKI